MVQKVGVEFTAKGVQQLQNLSVKVHNFNKLLIQTRKNTSQLAEANAQLVSSTMNQVQQFQQLNQTVSAYGSANVQLLDAIVQQNNAVMQQNDAMTQQLGIIAQNTEQQNSNTSSTTKNTNARNQNTKANNRNTSSWKKSLRTLVLWAAGSASVFLIIRKIRTAFLDGVKAIVGNTEEYENLLEAQGKVKIAFAAMLGTKDQWIDFLDTITEKLDNLSQSLLEVGASVARTNAVIEELQKRELAPEDAGLEEVLAALATLEEAGELTDVLEVGQQSYNDRLEETGELLRQNIGLTEAQKRAAEQATKALEGQIKRREKFGEALVEAERRRIEEVLALVEELRRREEDLQTERIRALEDLAIEGARKREDIETKFQRRLEDIRNKASDARAKAEDRLRLRLLAIELRYRERLIRIEEDFQDSIGDAIRTRDATAALQAIRRRNRDIGRAERQRDNDTTLAREAFENQIRDQQRALERQRQDAERARQRALEDLRRDMERERQDILLNQQREKEDLDLFWQRRLDDIQNQFDAQIAQAEENYNTLEIRYADHLEEQLRQLRQYWVEVAAANQIGMANVIATVPPGIIRPQMGVTPGQVGFAEGGVGFFSSPTTIQVAEARPEIVVALPIGPSSQGAGNLNASINGSIEGVMPGFEGRLSAMMTEAAIGAMSELLQ